MTERKQGQFPPWAEPGKRVYVVGHRDEGPRTVKDTMDQGAYPGGVILAERVVGVRLWNVSELAPWDERGEP